MLLGKSRLKAVENYWRECSLCVTQMRREAKKRKISPAEVCFRGTLIIVRAEYLLE